MNEPVTLVVPETKTFASRGEEMIAAARAFKVDSDEKFQSGADLCRTFAALISEIDATFGPTTKKAFEAHRALTGLTKAMKAAPQEADRIIRAEMLRHRQEQDKIRREEEERIRREAVKATEDRRLEQASIAEASGHADLAEAILDAPITAPVVHVPRPEAAGFSVRKGWGYRVSEPGAIKREFLMPDEKAISAVVKSLGPQAVQVVGGIEVFETETPVVRK